MSNGQIWDSTKERFEKLSHVYNIDLSSSLKVKSFEG